MDWYQEGRRWFDRSNSEQGYALYGGHSLTHWRALARLTNNAKEELEARRGFYDAMREFTNLPIPKIWDYLERMRNASF